MRKTESSAVDSGIKNFKKLIEIEDAHKGLHHILDKKMISFGMFQISSCISEVGTNFASFFLGSHLSKMPVSQQSTRS